jgi:nitroreductase
MNELIKNRRSIRKYMDKPIEDDKFEILMRAAMQAPSAGNQQPWEFIIVKDKEALNKLSEICKYYKMLQNANAAIIVLGNIENLRFPDLWQYDLSAAIENILLEGVNQGLGTTWMGMYPAEDRIKTVKDMYKLPENIMPFALISLGYPEGDDNVFVDRYDANRVHVEKW